MHQRHTLTDGQFPPVILVFSCCRLRTSTPMSRRSCSLAHRKASVAEPARFSEARTRMSSFGDDNDLAEELPPNWSLRRPAAEHECPVVFIVCTFWRQSESMIRAFVAQVTNMLLCA